MEVTDLHSAVHNPPCNLEAYTLGDGCYCCCYQHPAIELLLISRLLLCCCVNLLPILAQSTRYIC